MIDIPDTVKNNILCSYREVKRSLNSYKQTIASQTAYLNELQKEMDKLVTRRNEMSLFMFKNGINTDD